jgi:hypothetical protein
MRIKNVLVVLVALMLVFTVEAATKAPKPPKIVLTPEQIFINNIPRYLKMFDLNLVPSFKDQDLVFEESAKSKKDMYGILRQTGYLLNTIDFILKDQKISFSDTNVISITYSMFIIVDAKIDKNSEPNIRYDVYMDRGWLLTYFYVSSEERNDMLLALFDKYYKQLSPVKQSKI